MPELSTAFAALPLILVFALLVLPGGTPLRSAGLGVLSISAISLLPSAFQISGVDYIDAVIGGMLTTLPVAYVLLGGLSLAKVLTLGKALAKISQQLQTWLPDALHRTLALIFGVAVFFESVTGFGVGAVVCAPIFLSLGYAPLRAAALSLLGLGAVTWGAMAIGTTIGADLSAMPLNQIGALAVPLSLPLWLAAGLMALKIADVRTDIVRLWLWLVAYIVVFGSSLFVVSKFWSVELAGPIAGLCVLALALTVSSPGRAKSDEHNEMHPRVHIAITPLVILVVGLAALRTPGPLQRWASQALTINVDGFAWTMSVLDHPGTWMLLATTVAWLIMPATRSNPSSTLRQIGASWAAASSVIGGFVIFASIMTASGITSHLAVSAQAVLGTHLVWLVAPIGALGGFLTGSNTGSNAMLMQIQVAGAKAVTLPVDWVAATQNAAGANATFLSPGRVLLAIQLTGCAHQTAALVRLLMPVLVTGIIGATVMLALAAR